MVIIMSWSTTNSENKDEQVVSYADRKKAILSQIMEKQTNNKTYMCLGIWGEPKSAKSATAMDLLTEEDIKNDMVVTVFDFDNRAIDVRQNHYSDIENLIVYNPIKRNQGSLVVFEETMKNARAFLDITKEYLDEGKLKAVIVDGADKLLTDVCETKMREKHNLDADAVIKQPPFAWGDRNTPYRNLLHKEILELPCHRIVVAHSKDKYAGNANPIGVVANWHDSTEDIFTATVKMKREIKQGGADYTAIVEASARMPELIGSRRKVLSIDKGTVAWMGFSEVKECKI